MGDESKKPGVFTLQMSGVFAGMKIRPGCCYRYKIATPGHFVYEALSSLKGTTL
jgi:hypothetical protein